MPYVEYAVCDGIAELRLNRPEKLNAINDAMLSELAAALTRAESDAAVRAIVIAGNGRAFSAGFDLDLGAPPEGVSKEAFLRAELRKDYDVIMRFWDCPKPTIASVHGYCLGSSMEIAAVCDMTVAASDCRFGAPEVCYGSGIVCLVLPWIIGLKNAKEMLLTGANDFDANYALSRGLVNRVVEPDNLQSETARLARQVAVNDPLAVQLTKRAINESFETAGMREALEASLEVDIRIESTDTPESAAFNRVLEEQGPKAALAWRARQVGDDKD
jgi:enoyl-CoA hydratase/carnithine racemase